MVLIKWVVADVIANALEGNGRGGVLLEEVGAKKALFIGFNRFFILHMGVKRSTIRVSTLKEMKLCLR